MSYNDPVANGFNWTYLASDGSRVTDYPQTPQLLDIAALQRIYGAPIDTPLSGGQVFGFDQQHHRRDRALLRLHHEHATRSSPFGMRAAATRSTSPASDRVRTSAWPRGAFSSVGGLVNNLAIAFGTRIDTAIGGPGADTLIGNADGDVLIGGGGNDPPRRGGRRRPRARGIGRRHAGRRQRRPRQPFTAARGTTTSAARACSRATSATTTCAATACTTPRSAGAGNDTISVGGEGWGFGNTGDDVMFANGTATLFGGQGNDSLVGSASGEVFFGNLGDDNIQVAGAVSVYGGQGNDHIQGSGTLGEYLSGDIGDDTISGGGGADTIIGGPGADLIRGDLADPDPYSHASLPSGPNTAHAGDLFVYRALSDSTARRAGSDHRLQPVRGPGRHLRHRRRTRRRGAVGLPPRGRLRRPGGRGGAGARQHGRQHPPDVGRRWRRPPRLHPCPERRRHPRGVDHLLVRARTAPILRRRLAARRAGGRAAGRRPPPPRPAGPHRRPPARVRASPAPRRSGCRPGRSGVPPARRRAASSSPAASNPRQRALSSRERWRGRRSRAAGKSRSAVAAAYRAARRAARTFAQASRRTTGAARMAAHRAEGTVRSPIRLDSASTSTGRVGSSAASAAARRLSNSRSEG